MVLDYKLVEENANLLIDMQIHDDEQEKSQENCDVDKIESFDSIQPIMESQVECTLNQVDSDHKSSPAQHALKRKRKKQSSKISV